jgi:LysM repeat protein
MLLVVCLLVAQLVIGATTAAAAPPAYGPTYHRVRYGETLSSIGRLYGVNAYAIARANGLANPNYIYAGQVLLIPTYGDYHRPTYQYSHHYSYPCYTTYYYPYYYCWSSCYRGP